MSDPRVAIVGAGMSGLCMAHALQRAGIEDFTVYEKADEVGGTWRENRYPGLTCDVPSRFYSYSFAPNPDWSSYFSPGREIQGYFTRVTDELGLRRHIRFGAEVTQARWEDGRWSLRTSRGDRDVADVLVTATGVLHHPRVPPIKGLETFAGAAFHSARWDESAQLDDRRVAVIGTGSTGVQITTALARRTRRLVVFQRTAQWILPVANIPYSPVIRHVLRRFPRLNRVIYRFYQATLEAILGDAVTRRGPARLALDGLCRLNLRLAVRDRDLRRRLRPDYEVMCKRLVMSFGFYPALQRPGVELVTEPIERVEPRGIVTADGRLHELDVIVLATGFDAHAYMRPMEIVGEGGITLDEAWAGGPRAYRTVALPGFPNLFTLMGPHSPIGNHSLIAVAETQARYIMQWIERLRRDGVRSVAPTPEATARFNDELRGALPGTVWATGCRSWYLGADGKPELWPWPPTRHREMLRAPVEGDFETSPRDG
jgi:cation diffusion facilitator CzcD-associated flavoprotein CzcO